MIKLRIVLNLTFIHLHCFMHNYARLFNQKLMMASFVPATGDFVPYDQSIEPVANEDEAAQHAM